MTTVAAGAVCTTAANCTAASSCCQGYQLLATGTTQAGTEKVCWAAGTALVGLGAATATLTGCTTTGGCFLFGAACAKASGASTLAVSAAALATAVYVM